MFYKELKGLWYQDKEKYMEEYNARFNGLSTIKFRLDVHDSTAFVVITPEIALLIEKISALNTKISLAAKAFSPIGLEMFFNHFLVDEIKKTNEIEGVHSTRKEIEIIIKAKDGDKEVTKNRLFGLVSKYKALISGTGNSIPLKDSKDLRRLYDTLILPEIEPDDIPDGEIFRKESVSVYDSAQKAIHQGITPESKIIQAVEQLLEIVNDDSIGGLVKASVVQYFIGYIHPFYDGNGRLGRFLSSYLMSEILHPLVAIRLAYTIKNNLNGQNGYYKTFEVCNNSKNKGDITPFVIYMLNMILLSEKNIYDIINDYLARSTYYSAKLQTMLSEYKDNAKFEVYSSICNILVQNVLFTSEYLDYKTVADTLPDTEYIVKARIKELFESGIPIIFDKSGNKTIFRLDYKELEDSE